jgi:hypothetical protein
MVLKYYNYIVVLFLQYIYKYIILLKKKNEFFTNIYIGNFNYYL